MLSDCCGAYSEYADDIDICPDCLEHCEFYDEDEELCEHDFIPVNNDGKHKCRFCNELENN
jgi:hypothetical protein